MELKKIPLDQIPVGSILIRPKLVLITHCGLYYGNGQVFDSTISTGPRIVSFSEFAQGAEVAISRWPVLHEWELYQRIDAEIAAGRPYDLIINNCEHVVNRVLFGEGYSPQAQGAGVLAVIATVLVAL